MYPFVPGESLLNTAEFVFALLALVGGLVSSLWLTRA